MIRYRDKVSKRFVSKRAWQRSHGPKGKYARVNVQPRVSEKPAEPVPAPAPRPRPEPRGEPPGPPPEVPRREPRDYGEEPLDFEPDFDLGEEEYGEVTL